MRRLLPIVLAILLAAPVAASPAREHDSPSITSRVVSALVGIWSKAFDSPQDGGGGNWDDEIGSGGWDDDSASSSEGGTGSWEDEGPLPSESGSGNWEDE